MPNLITEESVGRQIKFQAVLIYKIVRDLCISTKGKLNTPKNEEFVLNSISFFTNLHFYDNQAQPQLIDQSLKLNVSGRFIFLDLGDGILLAPNITA